VVITLGRGPAASALRTEGGGAARAAAEVEAFARLAVAASVLDDAPAAVDATLGVGIHGPRALVDAYVRGLAVQLAWALSPSEYWVSALAAERWVTQLPHRAGPALRGSAACEFGLVGSSQPVVTLAAAESAHDLPGHCRVVVQLGGSGSARIVQHPERERRTTLAPAFVSHEEAHTWATDAATNARQHGLFEPQSSIPNAVALTPLLGAVDSGGHPSLAARVARGAAGDVVLDLVAHGPHAVVGGTTGSGKSELLIAWILAMASAHPPERVTFLLVDFKGGSAFDSLAGLAHTVGTITDLDSGGAARALASLRAELAFRERTLAAHGARSIDDTATVPRLVIVVDEFAAMLAEHPDLHALFADLAARGRSLGVHLVLCTQRPAGVVRDAVLANADLRISLRVNNVADSSAVVGTDAAATIPPEARGRAVIARPGDEPQLVQFALADPADCGRVAALWPSVPTPRRPWREPLPTLVPLGDVPPGGFGLLDLPAEQRWGAASWTPATYGNLLVLGGPGSGKSSALRAIAGTDAIYLPEGFEAAWDVVDHLVASLAAPARERVVGVDDLDALLARATPDHRAVFVERLTRLLREGGARGIRFVLAAQRLTGELASLAALAPARLWLRHPSRHELVLAGADGALHDDRLPPGGGVWQSSRVQVGWVEPWEAVRVHPAESAVSATAPLAIVSGRAAWLAQQLGAGTIDLAGVVGDPREVLAGERATRPVLIGDVDQWQSRWGALAAVRDFAEVVIHGCTAADFRALTKSRELPPPLPSDPALCWRLEADGSTTRARLPL